MEAAASLRIECVESNKSSATSVINFCCRKWGSLGRAILRRFSASSPRVSGQMPAMVFLNVFSADFSPGRRGIFFDALLLIACSLPQGVDLMFFLFPLFSNL